MDVFTVFFAYFTDFFSFFHHLVLTVWLCISFYTPQSYSGNLIFHLLLWWEKCDCLISPSFPFLSDWQLLSPSRYSCIPPLCCGVAVNQVCEMEMRTLSLSHSQPPSLSRHQNEAMPPMFFSDLGVLPNLISGAGRERGGGREWAECRGRRGGAGQKDERRGDEKWTRERGNVRDEDKAWDWSKSIWAFFSYYSWVQHNLSFFCWATTPSSWLRISW